MATFYDRDLGSFTSSKDDLSDLGGPYLASALRMIATETADALVERVARKLCLAAGDDPDMLAYPPMQHLQTRIPHAIYVPTADYHQPKPCWKLYAPQALVAIEALK